MTISQQEERIPKKVNNSLAKDYPYFYSNIYEKLQESIDEFFQCDFKLRFMGISHEENILFYGDEYFVNKIPVTKNSAIMIRISSGLVSSLLDNALGLSETKFELKKLTDIEARLIKSFTVFTYKNIENQLSKTEVNKKAIQNSKEYNFTFYVSDKGKHKGKMILTIPEYMLKIDEPKELEDKFSLSDFKKTKVKVALSVGSAKISLTEIKAIEDGDIIVLDNSDINKMSVLWDAKEIQFKIAPNPSLIISIDNNGDDEMEEETSTKNPNMWDSILVDIVAEFDNVKLTLGELKQISEGLVLDVGSVYNNKIKLRVENQVVATGELVILNDRYGVRIENVKKHKEETQKVAQPKKADVKPQNKQEAPKAQQTEDEEENFDYSDFEIEDESI